MVWKKGLRIIFQSNLTLQLSQNLSKEFLVAEPFNHIVIDDFWLPEVVEELHNEFPDYDDSRFWAVHHTNVLENKKIGNHWDKFSRTTYKAFNFLLKVVLLYFLRSILFLLSSCFPMEFTSTFKLTKIYNNYIDG